MPSFRKIGFRDQLHPNIHPHKGDLIEPVAFEVITALLTYFFNLILDIYFPLTCMPTHMDSDTSGNRDLASS